MSEPFKLSARLLADTFLVGDLPLCRLLLMNDCQYPWFILVPKVANVSELHTLTFEQQQQLLRECNLLSEWLVAEFNAEKINTAALGNVEPQLHVHVIARYRDDIAWPKPVWGLHPTQPYSNNDSDEVLKKARSAIIEGVN